MKVLIISDTHGKSSCLKQIHDIVGGVDMLIHLGDVEGDEKLIHDLFDCEIHMVRGNCDYNPELPIYDEFNIGDKKTFITHGHRRDLTCYKDSYIVNPGSLALPRDNRIGTYMLLDFDQHGTPFFAQNEMPRVESNVSSFRRKFDM